MVLREKTEKGEFPIGSNGFSLFPYRQAILTPLSKNAFFPFFRILKKSGKHFLHIMKYWYISILHPFLIFIFFRNMERFFLPMVDPEISSLIHIPSSDPKFFSSYNSFDFLSFLLCFFTIRKVSHLHVSALK